MVTSINMLELKTSADYVFHNGFTWGETVVYALNKWYDIGLSDDAISLSSGFPYGFGEGGTICGAVAGATMILGAVFGRSQLEEPLPKQCLDLTRELNDYIEDKYATSLCPEIIASHDFSSPERKKLCTNLVFDIIDCVAIILERERGISII